MAARQGPAQQGLHEDRQQLPARARRHTYLKKYGIRDPSYAVNAMTWFFFAAVVVLIAAFIPFARFRRPHPQIEAYASQRPLSDPEQTLFWRLREAMPECVVLSQVSFSRFIK